MSSDEAPAVSGKYRLISGCFNYFRKQQKQSRCHLFDANFGQLVKKSRIYNFAKGWKIIKLTIFTFFLQVICNWNNSSRVRELARRMERSQSRARWHSQTRFSGEILKLKSTKTTKNKKISNFSNFLGSLFARRHDAGSNQTSWKTFCDASFAKRAPSRYKIYLKSNSAQL